MFMKNLFKNLSSISMGNIQFWYLFSWSLTWLKVRLGWVRQGYVMLFNAKIKIIFGISILNNAGISIIYAEKQVALPGASPQIFDWGGRIQVSQNHLPPNSNFSSDFTHFILEILENPKNGKNSKKKSLKPLFIGGHPSRNLELGGHDTASPPVVPPMGITLLDIYCYLMCWCQIWCLFRVQMTCKTCLYNVCICIYKHNKQTYINISHI